MYSALKHLLSIILLSVSLHGIAQVRFTAEASHTELGRNEPFKVQFVVNANGSNFKAPSFSGFTVEQGPSRYIESQFINGRGSVKLSFSYVLRPAQTGTLTIGAARIEVDGEEYSTSPITIKVSEKSPRANDPNDPYSIAARSAFVKISVNKSSVYVGEPLVATDKLYFNTNINQPRLQKDPDFAGFYKTDVDLKAKSAVTENYNGQSFKTAVIAQKVLIPQKSGTLRPGNIELTIPTLVPTNQRNIFGQRVSQTINQTSVDEFPPIRVKELPEAGKPAAFDGAVGQYKFSVEVSRNEINASESVTLKVSLSGAGNIKLIQAPKPEIPNAFELYDPEVKERIQVNGSGMSGSKVYEYLLIPRYGGTYKIPSLSFSYFNPQTERYETISSNEIKVTVTGGAAQPTGDGGIAATETEKVGFIGKDILFIKTDAGGFHKKGDSFLGSPLFYVGTAGSATIFAAMLGYFFLVYNRKKDHNLERSTKASKQARKHLAKAKKELDTDNKDAFYLALTSALWGYFSDKFNIPNSKLSKEVIEQTLQERGLNSETVNSLMMVMNRAEMARFTSAASFDAHKDYEDTALLLTQIDKEV
jgi:hypothetical protein